MTRILELRAARYRHDGRATEREFVVIAAPDWVVAVALTPDHRLVLVNQFRFGIDELSLELPGGVIDLGEPPIAAGLRELAEETGYSAPQGVLLGCVHPNPAIQNNRCHLVLAEQAIPTGTLGWDADEEIAVVTAPVDEVMDWARSGRITHALTLNALFLFEPRWRELTRRGV